LLAEVRIMVPQLTDEERRPSESGDVSNFDPRRSVTRRLQTRYLDLDTFFAPQACTPSALARGRPAEAHATQPARCFPAQLSAAACAQRLRRVRP
jgi:hypothetical protein